MPETIIESLLTGKLDYFLLIKWLNNESIEDAPDDCILHCCTKSEFVAHFLTYLRNQTDSILQTNSNAVHILQNATPEKLLNTARKHQRSVSEPTSDEKDSLSVKDSRSHHESPNRDKKRTGRRVKTKLFPEDKSHSNVSITSNISSDESRLSGSVDRIAISTPMKNGFKPEFVTSPVTPRTFKDSYERCDTPRLRYSRTQEKSCLGDYLVNATKSTKKKTKKNTSNDDADKVELDLSNSEIFPEIGARKSSSLRTERKRIKPTNIDKNHKSLSLNSFNTEFFQSSSVLDDSAFKHQKFQPKETSNFEIERNILKQERHKLMEKFNLNPTPSKSITPHIKITQKESIEITQNFVNGDAAKIMMREKIDMLIEIYDILLKNNLILSLNTEIYFLISILVSKQLEDEYLNIETELNHENLEFLLKSIHNSTYFAVKSLWNQKVVLEVVLDKNSLKTLGENKKVRSFYPELAKFLLNCYCVRCEHAPGKPPPRAANVVNYNCETDNVDNFPTAQAFHLFKKQRDAFYDIVRWYSDTVSSGGSRSSFRARVKALLSHGATAANHQHLATLVLQHMAHACAPTHPHESKLSKLQRRLTCPTATDSNRLPRFTTSEIFYKEFITHAENESFRVHLRDALASEIVALDGAHIASEERDNSNLDVTREYLLLAKKLALLAKFLGYLTSLPYSQVPAEITSKNSNSHITTHTRELNYLAPKEKVLENNIGLRNYSQPTLDLKGLLHNASENYRLSITIPWLVHYLSMLDYTTLRLKYYNELLRTLHEIYLNKLKLSQNILKKNTIIYLKSILGWLFDLSHYPNDEISRLNSVGRSIVDEKVNSDGVDFCDLVDESTILELCPFLKEVNTLLSTCRLSQENKDVGSFRHITPVSLTVNPEDRIKNKEKELQARLEEELLKSQPSSTRRVLEMVVERVTSAAVKEITARELLAARERAREHARRALAANTQNHAALLQIMSSIYTTQLQTLRTDCLHTYKAPLSQRARSALAALLPTAPRVLHAVAAKMALRALDTWLQDHTSNTSILCKDIEAEMRTLISMNEMQIPPAAESGRDGDILAEPTDAFATNHGSVAQPIIHLKEHVCLMLEGESPAGVTSLLSACVCACTHTNIFSRAPARRAILHLSLDLCLVYVSRKPQEINDNFLAKFHEIWNTCCPDRKHHAPEEISLPERRDDISPEFRNFNDDERMQTPISDEENENGIEKIKDIIISEPIDKTSQPIAATSQPIAPTSIAISKWQPVHLKLLPINTKMPVNSRSQPASPMLQPINTKWPTTSRPSKSQPVSPKLQPVCSTWQPVSSTSLKQSTWQPISPTSIIQQPITWQPIAVTSKKQSIASSSMNDSVSPTSIIQPLWQPIAVTSKKQSIASSSMNDSVSPTSIIQPLWQPIAVTSKKQSIASSSMNDSVSPTSIIQPLWQPIAVTLNKQPIAITPIKNESEVQNTESDLLECFDRILCPRNIVLLNSSKCTKSVIWDAMATVLVFLLKNDYLSEDSLTEQCLAVYRQDWPQATLESLSTCMKSVSSRWARSSSGKFTLFLDFLAEYCGDMEYEPIE